MHALGCLDLIKLIPKEFTEKIPNLVSETPPYYELKLDFEDGFDLKHTDLTAQFEALRINELTFDHVNAHASYANGLFVIEDLYLRRQQQWLDLTFSLDTKSSDYHGSLIGSAVPYDYNSLLPNWWAAIFENVDFSHSDYNLSDFTIYGNTQRQSPDLYYGYAEASKVSYKDVVFDEAELVVRGRGSYCELHDLNVRKGQDWARGDIAFASKRDEVKSPASIRLDMEVQFALAEAAKLFKSDIATVITDFKTASTPLIQLEAAIFNKAYSEYVSEALKTDYIIGVFWCNPIDTPKGFSNAGVKQGFFGEGLTERPGLHQQVMELNRYIEATTQGTLLAKDAKLEKLASGYETVEGPLYDGKGHLLFTDIPNQHIWKLNLKTLNTKLFLDDTGGANGLAFDLTGRLLMCKQREKSLARLEEDGPETVLLKPTRIGGNKKIYPVGVNDVVVDRKGRIYVTVPTAGSIYLLDSDGENPRPVISGLKGPNGLMLSPDEKTFYVSEYKEQKLHAYDVDPQTGNPSNQRLFTEVEIPSDYGCDGMTVDHLGNLYCAGPYAVRVWNAQGKLLETIAVPESPTNCAFAGPGSNMLYITGRKNVFRIRLKTKGVR